MTEPQTEAGRELLDALTALGLRSPETDNSTGQRLILRIEAEATAAAEQRLRERIAEWREPEPRADMERGWDRALDAVLGILDTPSPRETP